MVAFVGRLNLLTFVLFSLVSVGCCIAATVTELDDSESCMRFFKSSMYGDSVLMVNVEGKTFVGQRWMARLNGNREATPEEYTQVYVHKQAACDAKESPALALFYLFLFPLPMLGYIFFVNGMLRWLFTGRWHFRF